MRGQRVSPLVELLCGKPKRKKERQMVKGGPGKRTEDLRERFHSGNIRS